MKIHTTNYKNTLIEIAEDCSVNAGIIPPIKDNKKSVAFLQFEMVFQNPYQFTSDEILFSVFASRNEVPENKLEEHRKEFFSKGQPCFRASPLPKNYGWGIHSNEEGKIAISGVESNEYKKFLNDPMVKKVKAMRSKRA